MNIDTKRSLAVKHKLNLTDRQLENVSFIECDNERNLLAVSGTIAVFNKPIYILPGIRLSPLYPNVGCSRTGLIYCVRTKTRLVLRSAGDEENYDTVGNPDKGGLESYKVHRIVASAWCHNPNPVVNFIVNHLDGIKINNYYKNLEWTTQRGNLNHAFDNGLIRTCQQCMVRDILEGVIHLHRSISYAAEAIGVDQTLLTYHLTRNDDEPKVIGNRYEVKYLSDKSPWQCASIEDIPPVGRYKVVATFQDGSVKTYWNVSKFGEFYLGTTGDKTAEMTVRHAAKRHPDIKFELIRRRPNSKIRN